MNLVWLTILALTLLSPKMVEDDFQSWMNLVASPKTIMGQPIFGIIFYQKNYGPKSYLQWVFSQKTLWAKVLPSANLVLSQKTLPVNILPHPSAHPFSLCFSFNPTYVGRGASETCFSVTVTCRPGSPLDIPIIEDDEGHIGVGGQDGLEGVALQKGRR